MATQLQIRRGTSSQVAAFTGAEGEVVVNTTNDSIHVNDGSTAGGFELARADLNNVSDTSLNAALTGNTVSALTVTALTTGSITTTGDISFGDNDKAIFGAGSDLEIFHEPNNSIIKESGGGSLLIQGDNIRLQKVDGTENMLTAVNDGQLKLFYDGSEKLATTSTGIDVTGSILTNGTLLVGKTADDNSVGFKTNTDSTYMVASGQTPTFINRLASDGVLLEFRKDSSAVGVIQAKSSQLSIGTGDTGIQTNQAVNAIIPHNTTTNANVDNSIDLGYAAGGTNLRFKDLKLSGGIYLGGVGSANKLSDYEEGTYTPDLQFGGVASGISWNVQAGRYTKVGRNVLVSVYLYTTGGRGSQTGNATVNLPFLSAVGHPDTWVPISNRSGISAGSNKTLTVYFPHTNFSSVRFYAGDNSGGANAILTHASFAASGGLEVSFTISFMSST